mgnify:CR=1 FL=1
MEFNFDFDVTPRPAVDPNAPRYATVPGNVADLGNGECVFRPRGEDVPHVMTHQVLGALDQCREFRTADEHVEAIRRATPGAPVEGIRRVFNSLVERGLIVRADAFVEQLGAAANSPQAPIGGLYVRACDRPAQLQRLLDSLREDMARHGRPLRVTVVDDSRDAGAASAQADAVAAFAAATRTEARLVGDAAWRRVQARLTEALPEHAAAIDRLIGRGSATAPRTGPGRGWNLALLLGAGERILFGDDDFVLPLKLHPDHRAGVDLAMGESTAARFYTDLDSALQAGRDPDFDALQWHLDLCGAPLAAVFDPASRIAPTPAQWRRLAPSRLTRLEAGARIAATMNGHRGDSGSVSSDWMFMIDADSARDLFRDRNRYLSLIERGRVWMGVAGAAASHATRFTPFAYDLSQLPAFVAPEERGEDATFGALTRILDPNAWILGLPTSIGHVRESSRNFTKPGSSPVARNFNYFLVDFLARFEDDLFAHTPQQRLVAAAARLEDLAAASDRDLLRMLGEYLQATHSGHVQRLQQLVAEIGANAPAYWIADLQAVVKANAKAVLSDDVPRLAGWPKDLDAAGSAARMRDDLTRFASLMRAWPAIWTAARSLDLSRSLR